MKKKLIRPEKGKVLAGVCLSIARYMDVDPTVVRVIWALLTVFTGFIIGIIAYIVAWIIIPAEK